MAGDGRTIHVWFLQPDAEAGLQGKVAIQKPKFPAPQVVWPKAGAVPPTLCATPAKLAPLLPADGGEPGPPDVPNGVVGGKGSLLFQRIQCTSLDKGK